MGARMTDAQVWECSTGRRRRTPVHGRPRATKPRSTPRSPGARRRRSHAGRAAGLATLPGVVLTTAFCGRRRRRRRGRRSTPRCARPSSAAGGDHQALVARSSSVVEDTAASSMAGQFDSIIGIRGFDAFVAAVTAVLDSRRTRRRGRPSDRGAGPAADRAALRRRDVRHRPGDRVEPTAGS